LSSSASPTRSGRQSSSIRKREKPSCSICRQPSALGPRDVATVVVVEDLHWIDAASEEFIDALADAVVGTTTLLVVNFRPGFTAPLMQRAHYRRST